MAVQKVRASAAKAQCANNFRQIGIALSQYHDAKKRYPAGTGSQNDPLPFLNWQARLLPHLDQASMWARIENAYQEKPNFLAKIHEERNTSLPLFICPSGGRTNLQGPIQQPALTYYLGVIGVDSTRWDGMLFLDSAVKLADVTDGASNTLLVGERPPSPNGTYGWWYAGWGQNKDGSMEAVLGVRELNRPQISNGVPPEDFSCGPGPYEFKAGSASNHCDIFHFWSFHSTGAHFLFVDGSVRFLSYSSNSILPALATRAGGEQSVSLPD